jgi:hypothetical protein
VQPEWRLILLTDSQKLLSVKRLSWEANQVFAFARATPEWKLSMTPSSGCRVPMVKCHPCGNQMAGSSELVVGDDHPEACRLFQYRLIALRRYVGSL